MRIAVFVKDITLSDRSDTKGDLRRVLLFDVEEMLITAAGSKTLSLQNIKYTLFWILAKGVKAVYATDLPDKLSALLIKAGIELHPLDGIRDNPYLKGLLIEEP